MTQHISGSPSRLPSPKTVAAPDSFEAKGS